MNTVYAVYAAEFLNLKINWDFPKFSAIYVIGFLVWNFVWWYRSMWYTLWQNFIIFGFISDLIQILELVVLNVGQMLKFCSSKWITWITVIFVLCILMWEFLWWILGVLVMSCKTFMIFGQVVYRIKILQYKLSRLEFIWVWWISMKLDPQNLIDLNLELWMKMVDSLVSFYFPLVSLNLDTYSSSYYPLCKLVSCWNDMAEHLTSKGHN
jgi:membrane-associated HD superfamily phosphohydrolase